MKAGDKFTRASHHQLEFGLKFLLQEAEFGVALQPLAELLVGLGLT
jgi:hypothetical protein